MTIGSLFSGIGGLELGLERAGLGPVIWQAESDAYCRRVLAKHWPGVTCYEDVRDIDEETERPDIICGGFPCQDISRAGRGAGIDGEKSGLWGEFARVLCALRPRIALIENVPTLATNGLGRVLRDLHESGYNAQWDCIPAVAIGAPHIRDRIFIVARHDGHSHSQPTEPVDAEAPGVSGADDDGHGGRHRPSPQTLRAGWESPVDAGWWNAEPDVARVVHGVSAGVDRVDRVRALGNAVVPQVAEHIGRLIVGAP